MLRGLWLGGAGGGLEFLAHSQQRATELVEELLHRHRGGGHC